MRDITQKIDAVTKIGDMRVEMKGIQPAPKSCKIEITAKCNLRCKYCAVRTRTKQPTKDMDFWLFQKITEDMRVSGVEEIGLFYLGESFMAKELLVKCTEWVKKEMEFPYVFLTSNAVNADSQTVAKLINAGMDSLKWSVNGANYEQWHDVTGGTETMFDQALKNIKNAHEVRKYNGDGMMISASSILYEGEQKKKMREFLNKHIRPYVDKHYWLPLYQMSMYRNKVKKEMGYTPTAGNMGRIDEDTMLPNRPPLPCWSVFTEGHVRVDGGLSACCFGADERFDMGLLDGTNFMRQWNSPKFQEIREAQLKFKTKGQNALKNTICEVCVGYN
jgi:uncharacterized Fe-S cluster-containing radical SAM superfamily protein